MERIISDFYIKIDTRKWDDPKVARRVTAINKLFGWLYDQRILHDVAFVIKDYEDICYFAFDVNDIAKYRKDMENSGIEDADVATSYIFDVEYTPCLFSGAIELTDSMQTFRSSNEVVSKSWECLLIRHMNSESANEILRVKKEQGVKAAILAMYNKHTWN